MSTIHPTEPEGTNLPVTAPPAPSYRPGDLVNGHVLQTDGSWLPVQPNLQSTIEQEVDRRTAGMKTNGWLLWLFLAGFNAHLFYIWPKARLWVALGTIFVFWPVMFVLTIITVGLIWPLWWLVSWIPLVVPSTWEGYREHVRRGVETDQLRRNQLYR